MKSVHADASVPALNGTDLLIEDNHHAAGQGYRLIGRACNYNALSIGDEAGDLGTAANRSTSTSAICVRSSHQKVRTYVVA